MTELSLELKGGLAPLKNTRIVLDACQYAINRPSHLPGIVVVHGWSGLGKSSGAAIAANTLGAYYVEARSVWTSKSFCLAILKEIGVAPGRTVAEMVDQIAEQLALSGRMLIVDEMDHIVDKKLVELVRDIYEASQSAILLIGEEKLPAKLQRWERFHGRILNWYAVQPADLDDARMLHKVYCDDIDIADELLVRIVAGSGGSVRRICVNLELIRQRAITKGLRQIGEKEWGDGKLFTGAAPKARAA